ncbi:MAG: YihY/virulence factor BrkB family protein [Nitrospiraceae bacterium]|nr:YihY/virulence factor BrkB family protein [Nitrospiraceae bacterium]
MADIFEKYQEGTRRLWARDISRYSLPKAWFFRVMKALALVVMGFQDDDITVRAASLSYTTLLGLVPFLAISFSLLKTLGMHKRIRPLLLSFLAPFGPEAGNMAGRIIDYINHINTDVLGSLGVVLLIYTVVSMVQKLEDSVNFLWKSKKTRSFARRFSDYMSVVMVGPVLIISALGITTSFMSSGFVKNVLAIRALGVVIYFLGKLVPYFFVSLAFIYIYVFLPTARVRFRAAAAGGVIAGVVWQSVEWIFAGLTVASSDYPAIYSSFAIILLFITWIYLNWVILLVGANASFYYQNPRYPLFESELELSGRLKEKLSLAVMCLVGSSHFHDTPPWTAGKLAARLKAPEVVLDRVLEMLVAKGLLAESPAEDTAYLPSRSIETISIEEVIKAARTFGERQVPWLFEVLSGADLQAVESTMEKIRISAEGPIRSVTVKDLVLAAPPAEDSGQV